MRRRRLRIDPPELNLVPLLDMVSLLIQMLLVEAQFGVFAEVRTTVAGGAQEASGAELALVVRLDPDGYVVSWANAAGEPQVRELRCPAGCAGPESWDRSGLDRLVTDLSLDHPGERSAVVQPGPGVPFEVVVATMDVLRGPDSGRFTDLAVAP